MVVVVEHAVGCVLLCLEHGVLRVVSPGDAGHANGATLGAQVIRRDTGVVNWKRLLRDGLN